eukprot:jgi/Chlat1/1473/Chrsp12S02018
MVRQRGDGGGGKGAVRQGRDGWLSSLLGTTPSAWALILLGVIVHAVYLFSIFDIYFKTPLVHGMTPVAPRPEIAPPLAKRLILFVGDGLRADKLFEVESDGPRAPFMRSIINSTGRQGSLSAFVFLTHDYMWGVSHARPPTESRPGHVSIIAGFYEDPSAVTKGWQSNPVEFDHVFNESKFTWAWGSPDILPIFCTNTPHSEAHSYSAHLEDFGSSSASELDTWVFERFANWLDSAMTNATLARQLSGDGLIMFLHLLGLDTNGHAYRPYSDEYLDNIRLVDQGVAAVYKAVEEHFEDNQTAYIFTADHGMSNKGNHGDGHPTNTETPLVAWGSGVLPSPVAYHDAFELVHDAALSKIITTQCIRPAGHHLIFEPNDDGAAAERPDMKSTFVDDCQLHRATPEDWGLSDMPRSDVNQADIATLMAAVLGIPFPMNAVGMLPVGYLKATPAARVEYLLTNAKQLLAQVLQKSSSKQAVALAFRPFMPLDGAEKTVAHIEDMIARKQFAAAEVKARALIALSQAGLHYFQKYDWLFLLSTVTLGYLGWMAYLSLHLVRMYTAHGSEYARVERYTEARLIGCIVGLLMALLLLVERSPAMYYAYVALPAFFWTEVLHHGKPLLKALRSIFVSRTSQHRALTVGVLAEWLAGFLLLEAIVFSFFYREIYTGLFIIAGVWAFIASPNRRTLGSLSLISCCCLSVFTLLPVEFGEDTPLVVVAGVLVLVLALTATAAGKGAGLSVGYKLLGLQLATVGVTTWLVYDTTRLRTQKQGLPLAHQLANWTVSFASMVLPAFSSPYFVTRLTSVMLGFAPVYLMLSISYESLFYCALAATLMAWVLYEADRLPEPNPTSAALPTATAKSQSNASRYTKAHASRLHLRDARIALFFLILVNVAFFGTGNIASVASFEISSVYRFTTIFDPWLMTVLLLGKLMVPFVLVTCAFAAVLRMRSLPRLGLYFMLLLLYDVMALHFLFLVRDHGSWAEIGASISHFAIMNTQVVFVLLLFALTHFFTTDLQGELSPSVVLKQS